MVSSMARDPVTSIFQNVSPNSAGVVGKNTNGLNVVAAAMGLPALSTTSAGNLANALGITTAQLANPNTVLPPATVAAINATGALRQLNLNNTSLVAYYQEVIRATGLVTTSGMLPTGDTHTGSLDVNDNAYGFYAGLNQEIHRGAGVFFNYAVADTGPQSLLASALMTGTGRNASYSPVNNRIYGVKQSMAVGVEVPMKALHLPWRHKDVLGFGYAQLKPDDAFGSTYAGSRNNWGSVTAGSTGRLFLPQNGVQRNASNTAWVTPNNAIQGVQTRSYMEHIMEMYYKVHVNDRFSITPNVQFIINRLGRSFKRLNDRNWLTYNIQILGSVTHCGT